MNQVDSTKSGNGLGNKKFLVSETEVNPDIASLSRLALVVFSIATIAIWYYYARYADEEIRLSRNAPALSAGGENADPATSSLARQGASDEVGAIEDDLRATNLNSLDRELADISAALQ